MQSAYMLKRFTLVTYMALSPTFAFAQELFYRGKTMTLVNGTILT
jgi:hypothetical protein